jgi:hypothetical protein
MSSGSKNNQNLFMRSYSARDSHRKAAKGAEGLFFLKRRDPGEMAFGFHRAGRQRFKKHPPGGSRNTRREAAERFSFAGVSAANEKINFSAASAS